MSTEHSESRTKKTFLNARINLICYFVSLITTFFTRKILLEHLGTEFIGLTGTIGNLLGFLNLAELGIGSAIGYVLYKPIANKDRFKINEIISILGYLYRWIGFVIFGAGVVLSLFLPLIFPNTPFSWFVIYFGFYAYLAAALIGYFANYKAALLSADQRNYIVTSYFQLSTTSKVILQMIFAIYYCNFILYFSIELLFGIINSLILNWKINKTYPWLNSELKLGSKLLKKYPEIGKYIKQIFAHKVGGVVLWQLTPFLVYSFASLPMVALYTNYTMLTQKLEGLVSAILNSTGAAIGNLVAEDNKEKILTIFKNLLALRLFIASLAAVCIYKFASPFIAVWLGREYILPNITVAIIAIMGAISITRGFIDQFIHAYGLYGDVWAPYIESIIMLVIAILCGYNWGLPGVLCGPIASVTVIIYIWKPYYLFTQGIKISIFYYWKLFIGHILTSILTLGVSNYIFDTYIIKYIEPDGWATLIFNAVAFAILSTILLAATYYITSAGFRGLCNRIKLYRL